jgi:hypothetical protein
MTSMPSLKRRVDWLGLPAAFLAVGHGEPVAHRLGPAAIC